MFEIYYQEEETNEGRILKFYEEIMAGCKLLKMTAIKERRKGVLFTVYLLPLLGSFLLYLKQKKKKKRRGGEPLNFVINSLNTMSSGICLWLRTQDKGKFRSLYFKEKT